MGGVGGCAVPLTALDCGGAVGGPSTLQSTPKYPPAGPCASSPAPTYLPNQRRQAVSVKAACGRPPKGVDGRRCGASIASRWGESRRLVRFRGVDPKHELLERLSEALTRGQEDFTEEELALAFEEVFKMLIQAQHGELILEGKLNLRVSNGTVLYTAAKHGEDQTRRCRSKY